jgi:cation diffusion facilitator CzcD-associated flavoprotein CzcO
MSAVDAIIVGAGTAGLGALREVRKRALPNDGAFPLLSSPLK